MAETTKLQADAGPTTLPVYASGAHEYGNTPEPLAGSSSVGTKDPGHQQTENFDIKTLDAHIQRTLTLRPLDVNNQRSLTLMNSWPSSMTTVKQGLTRPLDAHCQNESTLTLMDSWPFPMTTVRQGITSFHDSVECVKCIDGIVQDCSNSSALAIELLQSCTKSSVSLFAVIYSIRVVIHPSINLFILSIYELIHH